MKRMITKRDFMKRAGLLNEVVSMVQPTKFHDRVSPTSKILNTFHNQNEKSIEDMDDDEEIDLEEILREMGYGEDEDELSDEELDEVFFELTSTEPSKGYKQARKFVDKLRRDTFRKLNDDELDDFMDVISRSFGLVKR